MNIEETITNECEKICKNMNERITSLTPLIMKMKTKFDENSRNEIKKILKMIEDDCHDIFSMFWDYKYLKTRIDTVQTYSDYNKK